MVNATQWSFGKAFRSFDEVFFFSVGVLRGYTEIRNITSLDIEVLMEKLK